MVGRNQRLLEMLVHHGRRRLALERGRAGHEVIEGCTQRINISAEVDVYISANLLRRNVIGGSISLTGFALGRLFVIDRASQTQVGQLGDALGSKQNVL